jgi:hypothetical protein
MIRMAEYEEPVIAYLIFPTTFGRTYVSETLCGDKTRPLSGFPDHGNDKSRSGLRQPRDADDDRPAPRRQPPQTTGSIMEGAVRSVSGANAGKKHPNTQTHMAEAKGCFNFLIQSYTRTLFPLRRMGGRDRTSAGDSREQSERVSE